MNNTKNYRIKHICIAIVAIAWIGQEIFFNSETAYQIGRVLMCLAAFYIGKNHFEKKDELVRQNLSKATGVAFWGLLIALFLVGGSTREINKEFLYDYLFFVLILGAVALRSIAYVIIDRPVKGEDNKEDEENEI